MKGRTIVVVDVKEYPVKPISYKNRYFLRRANSNHVRSMEEIANEYLKTKNSSWYLLQAGCFKTSTDIIDNKEVEYIAESV